MESESPASAQRTEGVRIALPAIVSAWSGKVEFKVNLAF
jgi:hypothetical protein